MIESEKNVIKFLKELKKEIENSKDKSKMLNFVKHCVKENYCPKCLNKLDNNNCKKCKMNYKKYLKRWES